MPLFPLPRTSAGGRLQKLMGVTRGTYLRVFDRVNLLQQFPGKHKRDDKFPMAQARIAAGAMWPMLRGREVVLVGRNVACAFDLSSIAFHNWMEIEEDDIRIAVVPHPSGRNLWYNSELNKREAQAFWAEYLAQQKPLARLPRQVQGEATA